MMRGLLLGLLLLVASCMSVPIHQGNVLDEDKIRQIQVGDSRFEVESLLGDPVLEDSLHPNQASYVEDFEDPETGERIRRGVVIIYDRASRVSDIRIFGFDAKDRGE